MLGHHFIFKNLFMCWLFTCVLTFYLSVIGGSPYAAVWHHHPACGVFHREGHRTAPSHFEMWVCARLLKMNLFDSVSTCEWSNNSAKLPFWLCACVCDKSLIVWFIYFFNFEEENNDGTSLHWKLVHASGNITLGRFMVCFEIWCQLWWEAISYSSGDFCVCFFLQGGGERGTNYLVLD